MLVKIAVALGLMAACVIVHAAGITWSLGHLERSTVNEGEFWPATWLCIRLAARMVACHLVEIGFWAALYVYAGAISDMPSASYFSAVTYTTTGYGDLVLPLEWRLVGGVEALTGILMCGWSTAFFFAAVSRLHAARGSTR